MEKCRFMDMFLGLKTRERDMIVVFLKHDCVVIVLIKLMVIDNFKYNIVLTSVTL